MGKRIKITWEMTREAAIESVMRAGSPAPFDEAAVLGHIRRSRHKEVVLSGWFSSRIGKQGEGYRIVELEVVD